VEKKLDWNADVDRGSYYNVRRKKEMEGEEEERRRRKQTRRGNTIKELASRPMQIII